MRNILFISFLLLSACSSGKGFFTGHSSLEVRSMGVDQVVLNADCLTTVCMEGFANEGEIWMTDIPMDQLRSGNFRNGQIIRLQILWTPIAGKTPLASTSTNLTIEHIIIADGEVGVYSGGGYCWSSGNPRDGMHLIIEESTITLQEHTDGFVDLLTPANMTGDIASHWDPTTARQIEVAAKRITG